jgi:hypothetical protein
LDIIAEVIPSENYSKIIQINVPIRFYWDEDGFDGIEMIININWGEFPIEQKLLIDQVLETMSELCRKAEA